MISDKIISLSIPDVTQKSHTQATVFCIVIRTENSFFFCIIPSDIVIFVSQARLTHIFMFSEAVFLLLGQNELGGIVC